MLINPLIKRTEDRPGAALAMLELTSVARGMRVADALVKEAAVSLLSTSTTTPGKYIIVFGGGEEEVLASLKKGRALSASYLIDELHLPQADEQLQHGLRGVSQIGQIDALGIVESFSIAATLRAADRALKAADVRLMSLRLGKSLGGKGYFVITGDLNSVQAAVDASHSIIHQGMLLNIEVIARPHADFIRSLLEQ